MSRPWPLLPFAASYMYAAKMRRTIERKLWEFLDKGFQPFGEIDRITNPVVNELAGRVMENVELDPTHAPLHHALADLPEERWQRLVDCTPSWPAVLLEQVHPKASESRVEELSRYAHRLRGSKAPALVLNTRLHLTHGFPSYRFLRREFRAQIGGNPCPDLVLALLVRTFLRVGWVVSQRRSPLALALDSIDGRLCRRL